MKITLDFKVRGFILAAAFITGLGFGTTPSHKYTIHTSSTSTARRQPILAL